MPRVKNGKVLGDVKSPTGIRRKSSAIARETQPIVKLLMSVGRKEFLETMVSFFESELREQVIELLSPHIDEATSEIRVNGGRTRVSLYSFMTRHRGLYEKRCGTRTRHTLGPLEIELSPATSAGLGGGRRVPTYSRPISQSMH